MVQCASGLLMSALTLVIILLDMYNERIDYVVIHSILGGILITLFFTMCNYGLETINWVFLGFIPGYILFSWLLSKKHTCHDCDVPTEDTCNKPPVLPPIEPQTCKPMGCPANPLRLATKCGISRYT